MGVQQIIINNQGLINGLPCSQRSRVLVYSKMESMHINDIQHLYILLFQKSFRANRHAGELIAYAYYFIGEYIRVRAGIDELRLTRTTTNMGSRQL